MSQSAAELFFWIAAAICAVAQIAIFRLTLRAREIAPTDSDAPARQSPAPRTWEIAWSVIPALGLAALLTATWRAIH